MTHATGFPSALFAAALAFAAPAADAIDLVSVADAFVNSGNANGGNPDANYGGAGALQVSAPGAAKGEFQSLLRFDLAPARAEFDGTFGIGNWSISSVTLQLGTNFGVAGTNPNNPIFNTISGGAFKIDWQSNDNWGEGTGNPGSPFFPPTPPGAPIGGVTFNTIDDLMSAADRTLSDPTFTYLAVGSTNPSGTPPIPPATYSLRLDTSFVADLSAGGLVSLRAYAEAGSSVNYLFNARSFGTTTNRPTLIVNAVPEPASGALLAAGAGMWLVRRRRDARPG